MSHARRWSSRRLGLVISVLLTLGLPLVLCVIYSLVDLGSIGPWIPITGLVNAFVLPGLSVWAAAGLTRRTWVRVLIAPMAVLAGVFFAVLGMNAFIALTWLFGLMDYDLM